MSAKINDTPIKIKSIVPRVSKKLSVQRPPGQNSDAIEGLGSQGAELQIELQADTLAKKHSWTAEFLKTGPQSLEDPDGFIYNIVESQATGGRNYESEPNIDQRWLFGMQCLMEEPYKYSSNQLIKSRVIDTNNQEWSTDNLYYGNLLENWSFENWSSGTSGVPPDGWVAIYDTITQIERSTEHVFGEYGVKLAGYNSGKIEYVIPVGDYIGEEITFAVWVKSDSSNTRIQIDVDNAGGIFANHSGSGAWELLTVSRTINAGTNIYVKIIPGAFTLEDTTCYIDGAVAIESSEYNETYHKSIEEYRLSGNYLDNWSFENWSSGINNAPDGWRNRDNETSRSIENVIGQYSNEIIGGGTGATSNYMYYPLDGDILDGKTVTYAAWVKSSVSNSVKLSIRRDDVQTFSPYHSGSGDWELLTVSKTWDKGVTNNEVRIILPLESTDVAYVDAAYLTLSSNYSPDYINEVVPHGLVTDGTIDVIPDVEVVAGELGPDFEREGLTEQIYDPARYTPVEGVGVTFTKTFSAVPGKSWRLDPGSFFALSASYPTSIYIYAKAASYNGGVEKLIYTVAVSGYRTYTYIPTETVVAGENEDLRIRYYMGYNINAYVETIYTNATQLQQAVTKDLTIYNTADTTRKTQVCNEIPPGTTVNINRNGTGSLNYPEDFSTDTYKYVSYDYNNITYDSGNDRITLAGADGYLIYPVDCKFPITGIPTLALNVHSGVVKIAIAENVSGAPGIYYDIDSLTSTNYSSETVTFLLDNLINYRLKGETSFFLKIYTDGATDLVLNSLEFDTDLITIDTLLPKIYLGGPNTFRADQNSDSSLNATVTLTYRDGHWVI